MTCASRWDFSPEWNDTGPSRAELLIPQQGPDNLVAVILIPACSLALQLLPQFYDPQ